LHRAVRRWISDRHPDIEVSKLACHAPSAPDGTIMTVGPFSMLLLPIARRLPADLFVADVAQTHAFPGWRDALDRQTAHIIVTPLLDHGGSTGPLGGNGEETRRAALATLEVACALATLPDATGVYWGPSGLFHDCRVFAERRSHVRKTNAELLVRLRWYGQARPRGEGFGVMTQGLATFAGRELLHPPTADTPDEIHGRIVAVCSHLIEHGPMISDGCTVGRDPDERFRIVFDRTRGGADVLRLDLAEELELA
jgi:hypothetical protein